MTIRDLTLELESISVALDLAEKMIEGTRAKIAAFVGRENNSWAPNSAKQLASDAITHEHKTAATASKPAPKARGARTWTQEQKDEQARKLRAAWARKKGAKTVNEKLATSLKKTVKKGKR